MGNIRSLLNRTFGRSRGVDPLMSGDNVHVAAVKKRGSEPILNEIREGLALLGTALTGAPNAWSATFSNDFSAIACFTRSFRQVRAATLLAHFGYQSEVAGLLRGAYESAGLGRYLAKRSKESDKWLREHTWFPDRQVRRSIGEKEPVYADFYGWLSEMTHPTARSCLPLLIQQPSTYSPALDTQYSEPRFLESLRLIASTLMFVCFAFRNSAASEDALPPWWHRALAEFARRLHPDEDWSHLEKDWQAEDQRWSELVERIGRSEQIDDVLDRNPRSWRNINRGVGHDKP